jgi:hypothetical protein
MKARALITAARNVLGRQTVAGGSVAVAVSADDPIVQALGVLVLVVNAVADFVIELRTRKALTAPPAPPAP